MCKLADGLDRDDFKCDVGILRSLLKFSVPVFCQRESVSRDGLPVNRNHLKHNSVPPPHRHYSSHISATGNRFAPFSQRHMGFSMAATPVNCHWFRSQVILLQHSVSSSHFVLIIVLYRLHAGSARVFPSYKRCFMLPVSGSITSCDVCHISTWQTGIHFCTSHTHFACRCYNEEANFDGCAIYVR